jgi:hypothetical protein
VLVLGRVLVLAPSTFLQVITCGIGSSHRNGSDNCHKFLPDGILSVPIYIDSKPIHDSEISNNSWNLQVELVIQREVSSFDEGVHVCEHAYGWGFFTN